MLSTEDIEKFAIEHFSRIDESNYESLIRNYLTWLFSKHDELDAEAQQYVDTVFDNFLGPVREKIEAMEDSPEKRQAWRTYNKAVGDYHDIVALYGTLEIVPTNSDPRALESEQLILKYAQHLSDVLFDIKERLKSSQTELICLSLFYACIDEILAALHLGRHHFYIQGNSHLRTILETLDKIELFIKDPSMINIWQDGDYHKKQSELGPSATRKKLGRKSFDELYGFFSEHGTHPTYRSLQDRVVQRVNDNPRKQIRIWYGGTPLEPHMISFYTLAVNIITRILLKAIDFGAPYLNEKEVMLIFDGMHSDIIRFHKEISIPWAKENDLDTNEFEKYLEKDFSSFFKSPD